MLDFFRDAWQGWGGYIRYGKLAAVFLAILLFLWFYKKGSSQKAFVLYASVAALLCICPLTAGLLMWYQTRFYDYEWIWSLVPLVSLTAFGLTLFLTELWEKDGKRRWHCLAVTGLVLAMILLAGGLGDGKWDSAGQEEERQAAYRVIEQVSGLYGESDICLWAPEEIMEYAREADADITLLYGRNMWDLALNGYSYDVYEDWKKELYLWMEQAEEHAEAPAGESAVRNDESAAQESGSVQKSGTVEKYAGLAREAGVNCVLLPGGTSEEIVWKVAEVFGCQPQLIEEYWVIYE